MVLFLLNTNNDYTTLNSKIGNTDISSIGSSITGAIKNTETIAEIPLAKFLSSTTMINTAQTWACKLGNHLIWARIRSTDNVQPNAYTNIVKIKAPYFPRYDFNVAAMNYNSKGDAMMTITSVDGQVTVYNSYTATCPVWATFCYLC